MNYKSKKAVFDEKIINKEEISADTKKKMRDSKYLILLMDIFMICVNGFMLTYFMVKGFNVIVLSLLCVVLAMDVIHFGLSFVLNYRFKYNMVFTLVYSVVSLLLTGVLYLLTDILNKGITVFETFGVGVSIAVRLLYFIIILVAMMLIAKKKIKMAQPIALILVAGLLFGATITYNVVRGVYGVGSGLLEGNRTLEYRLRGDGDDKYYEVVGSLESNYANIVVPDEFNGHKVRAVDYSVFLTEGVKNIELKSTEPIAITNSVEGGKIADDLKIQVNKDLLNEFKASIYDYENLNSNLTNLINKVDPILPSDEFAIKFNFDASNMPSVLKGKYLDTIFLKKGASTTLNSIFNATENADYKDFFLNNYLDDNYKWNYDQDNNKKAMVMSTNIGRVSDAITENTEIKIHFEDVIKITYNFSPELEDVFEINVVNNDPTINKDKYVIQSDVNSIEFYEDIRPGCTVQWSLKGEDLTATEITSKGKVAEILEKEKIKTEERLAMVASWTMIKPEIDQLEVQKDSVAVNSIVYGDTFDVEFNVNCASSQNNIDWVVTNNNIQLIHENYNQDWYGESYKLLSQSSTTGLTHKTFTGIAYEDTVKDLLQVGTVKMTLYFEAIDENWASLKAKSDKAITLYVTHKDVELNWTFNGVDYPTGDIVYNADNNTVDATIKEDAICAYDIENDKKPALSLTDYTFRYAGSYNTTASITQNTNYAINGQAADVKNTVVKPADIKIKYTISADGNFSDDNNGNLSLGLDYIGYKYTVAQSMTIQNKIGEEISLADADDISIDRLYTVTSSKGSTDIRNAGAYTISYTLAGIRDDLKNSYRFVNNTNRVVFFDLDFSIRKAEVKADTITWNSNAIIYNAQAQSLTGTFKGVGSDISDPGVNKTVNTVSETDAGLYINSAVSIEDTASNYVLANAATVKDFRIEKKVINDNEIRLNKTTETFSNTDLNGGDKGFKLSSTINGEDISYSIENATLNGSQISEFINVGSYSNLNIKIDSSSANNYSFTAFNTNETDYTDSKEHGNLTFAINKYTVLGTNLMLIQDKIYDNGYVAIPTTITGTTFNQTLTYDVTLTQDTDRYGINVGDVYYTISSSGKNSAELLANYDLSVVIGATFKYNISKRKVRLTITDLSSIIYTGKSVEFAYKKNFIGNDYTACETELAEKDFISFTELNAVDVKASGEKYTIIDKYIAANFASNYSLDTDVDFAILPYDISKLEINWNVKNGEYNGQEQGLSGTFTGLNGTIQNIEGAKFTDVKRNGYLVNNAKVLAYEYTAADFTIDSLNYVITSVTDLTYTITPKKVTQTGDNTNLNSADNYTYTFTYNGESQEMTTLYFNDSDKKIGIKTFRGSDFSENSRDFTNATVNENNEVVAVPLFIYSADGNYEFDTSSHNYSIKIDKQMVELAIATQLVYNGTTQRPSISNTGFTVTYDLTGDTDHKNVGDHSITVILDEEYRRNYTIKGSANSGYTKEVSYNITPYSVNINNHIEYKATQNIDDIPSNFDNMISIDNIVYNGKPWYIVARVAIAISDNVTEYAFIYTGSENNHFNQTDASTYSINIYDPSITAYGEGSTLVTSNYAFTNALSQSIVIQEYEVTQEMMKVYLNDISDNNLITNPKATYNGQTRDLKAEFTPKYADAQLIELNVNVEEIKNAGEYIATFAFSETSNFKFADAANTLTFNIERAVIDASTNQITWTKDRVDYKASRTEPFEGTLNYDNMPIQVISDFDSYQAGEYEANNGYTDSDFILSDTNYSLANVTQKFVINKAVIKVGEILWYDNDSTNGVTVNEALYVSYNYGAMPIIVAKYSLIVGDKAVEEIAFKVEPSQVYENYSVGAYKFSARLQDGDANNYMFAESDYAERVVNIVKLKIENDNAINWEIPGATKNTNGEVIVEYTGSSIIPIATIGEKAERLTLETIYEYVNVSDTAYTVRLNAEQANFTYDNPFEFSYYIVKKELTADDVIFRNNKNTDGTVAFEYKEDGYVATDLAAYVMINNQEVPVVVVADFCTQQSVGGSYQLTVSFSNNNVNLASATIDYTVVPKDIEFIWSDLTGKIVDLPNLKTQLPRLSINGSVVGNVIDGLSVQVNGEFVAVKNNVHLVNAGSYTVKYTDSNYSDNPNYNIINEEVVFMIDKRDIVDVVNSVIIVEGAVVYETGEVLAKPTITIAGQVLHDSSIKFREKVGETPTGPLLESVIKAGSYAIVIECSEDEVNLKGTKTLRKSFVVRSAN